MTPADVSVSTTIARPPSVVWAAVADPSRIARWSPENTGATALAGALTVGTRFGGSNRNGLFRWTTTCLVVEADPDRAFAFDVSFAGQSVARWRYVLTAVEGGCLVEEQWWDRRGALMAALGVLGTGVRDRAAHNEETMRVTLAAMKQELEGS